MLGLTAEQIGTVILGFSIALISLMGGQKGKQIAQGKTPQASDMVEVAGALVNSKDVERIVGSLDAFTAAAAMLKPAINRDVEAKTALTKALSENSRGLNRNSDTADDMRDEIKDVRVAIERLKDELIRSGRGRTE
ncbi:hypothetical protein [Paracoccus fontiphilus]|uniref:Uncharacterized protein n=1 Tax=Paracoccus fontiphilus TaxID=1815556 RepID=A0ABV7IIA9_9RHOB|nr:hypothetical protein [Paracoccus fontiphilus]